MTTDAQNAARLDALETLTAHQQRQIDELSDALADAWKERQALRRDLDGLRARFDSLRDEMDQPGPAYDPVADRPPHW